LENQKTINQVLSIEGGIWEIFYSSFKKFLPEEFTIQTRVKRPPDNAMNALISFANSVLYTYTL
jgi:CRISPR-associated protein Cas1